MSKRAPGPSRWELLRNVRRIRRDVAGWLVEQHRRHGPAVLLPLRWPTFLLTTPEDIKHILVTNPRNYHKTGGLTVGKELLGRGLVSSEPPLHTKQRRVMQPMFHRQSIARFGEWMTEATEEHLRGWRDGAVLDLSLDMMELTMAIAAQALFSTDLRGSTRELALAFTEAQRLITRRQRRVPIPVWVPTPTNHRYRRAIARIDEAVHGLIARRRTLAEQPPDLLGMLLAARFEDGSPMPDQQVRDEVTTLLMAGHETVSNMLCWTFYLLSQHPAVEARLHAEWRAVLGGRTPALADLPALRYTDQVLAESMRLYPPAWTLARRAVRAEKLPSGLELRPNDEILLSQYVCHRNPEVFPDPERFDPGRWTPEFVKEVSPYVYFPFGSGPRYCIGEQFARVEAALVLPTLGQRFRLKLVPGQVIATEPLISLRPRYGMKMELEARAPAPEPMLTGSPSPR
jgi:cytochrome P450